MRANTYFSNRFYRIKDGENFSPVYELKIKNLLYDSNQNGISDTWENYYNLPLNHNRDSDTDNDGLSNFEEYLVGSDPSTYSRNQSLNLENNILNFNAKFGDIYLLKNSIDLMTFTQNNDLRLEISSNEDIDGDGKLEVGEDLDGDELLDISLNLQLDFLTDSKQFYQIQIFD